LIKRKTGIVVPDSGRRDEEGFEVMTDLFSSPENDLGGKMFGRSRTGSVDEQNEPEEQTMEIDDGTLCCDETRRDEAGCLGANLVNLWF
jgi:hypothetical protein